MIAAISEGTDASGTSPDTGCPVGAAPGLSHRRPAKCSVFLAFPSGIPYATRLRHLVSGGTPWTRRAAVSETPQ